MTGSGGLALIGSSSKSSEYIGTFRAGSFLACSVAEMDGDDELDDDDSKDEDESDDDDSVDNEKDDADDKDGVDNVCALRSL